MAWRIDRWGDPWGSGWWDWPAGLIERIDACLNTYNAFSTYSSAHNLVEFTKSHPAAWALVTRVMSWRNEYDD